MNRATRWRSRPRATALPRRPPVSAGDPRQATDRLSWSSCIAA